jgi:F420-dependent oxidoreductase-like protein
MKLGFWLGYSGAKMELPIKQILRAEALGFDSVWTAETYGSDAVTPLAYIGALTKRIKLATGIAQLAARTPANLAMCAQTIDALAGEGRMILGIGVSGPQIVEGWYGEPWGKPAERLRDYVTIIRKILKRDGPVAHDGKEIALPYRGPGSSGLGKPLKSILHGNPNIPILLGTATPGNIRLTAEIADGWLSMSWVPGAEKSFEPLIAEGLKRRQDGKTRKNFHVQASIKVDITDDVKSGLARLKPEVALYVGGMGAKDKNFHNDKMIARGFPDAAKRIQELFLAGRKDEATDAVPDEYIDQQALVGPPARLKERWKAWVDSGVDGITLTLKNDDALETMAKVAL